MEEMILAPDSLPLMAPVLTEGDWLALAGRSPRWPKVRAAHVRAFPACACCGAARLLNVHHVLPFHKYPELEERDDNLITLCEGGLGFNCHLWVGHAGNWRAWNTTVRRDAAAWGLALRSRQGIDWVTKKGVG